MDSSKQLLRRTRREFFSDAAKLGIGAAGLAVLGPHATLPAFAQQSRSGERIQALMHDLVESSPADFARGQARGVQVAAVNGRALLRGSAGGEFISGAMPLPFQATHLGLHWVLPQDSPGAVAVEMRTSSDGRTWSDWTPLSIEAVKDVSAGREIFAALASGERGRFAQYRLTFQTDGTATLEAMTVTAINSVDGPRLSVASSEAEPASGSFTSVDGAAITVITRGGWGCNEGLRFSDGTELWPEMYVPVKKYVLHHTATGNAYTDGAAEVRAIYSYHTVTQGWGDIGYNSLVDRFGTVYEGRHGRGEGADREILSASVAAGHVSGHNYGSTGLAAIGNSSAKSRRDAWAPEPAFWTSVEDMTTFECGRHYLDPSQRSDFLKFDGTWHDSLDNCSGHYQSTSTECPGAVLKDYLPTLRSNVSGRLGGGSAPSMSETSGATRDVATSGLSFEWSAPGAGSYYYYLEGWGRIGDYDVDYISGYEPAGYDDPLAMRHAWLGPVTSAGIDLPISKPGRYTMHVRTESGRYEANLTYNVTGVTPTDSPPTAKWESPAAGATVSGTVAIEISATDDNSVQKVEWLVDGGGWAPAALDSSTGTYKSTWDTGSVGDGSHALAARATDSAGQVSSLVSVTVTVDDSGGGGGETPAVAVSNISPNSMKSGSSANVTITGSGFAPGASVLFENGQGATPSVSGVTVVDVSTITATVSVGPMTKPPPRDRVWDVRVTGEGGASGALVDGFTITP